MMPEFSLLTMLALVVFCGIIEGIVLAYKNTTGPKVIFKHFSVYHVFLLIFLIVVCGWYLPLGILIQDVFSHLAKNVYKEEIDGVYYPFFMSWVLWPHDKVIWPGIPRMYYGLAFLQAALSIYFIDVIKAILG